MGAPKGHPKYGGGRAKGTPNKLTADLREMVRQALELEGGVDYLRWASKNEPRAFLALVGRCVPVDLKVSEGIELIVRDFTGATREAPKVIEAEAKEEKA